MSATSSDQSTTAAEPIFTPMPVGNGTVSTPFERIEQTLDELDTLLGAELEDPTYQFEPLGYELPESFCLTVVVPVYNEEATLGRILARVSQIPIDKELILVDDCSSDGSAEILKPLERVPGIRVIYKVRNGGKGSALRTGFAMARGDVVIVQDADLEYDPRDIPNVIRPIVEDRADVVYGSRFLSRSQQDPSWLHRLGNGLLTRASNLFTGLKLTDMETCYKAFRREALQDIDIRQDRFGFEPEVTAKLARRGCRITEVPICYDGRGYRDGKKIGLRDAVNALFCIIRYGLWD